MQAGIDFHLADILTITEIPKRKKNIIKNLPKNICRKISLIQFLKI
jgi:hypothetical protein